jgi:hypothetical protein
MKIRQSILWLGLLSLALPHSACALTDPGSVVEIAGVGDIVAKEYDVSGYDELEVAGFFETEVRRGEEYRLVIEAERALVPYLEVHVHGDRLTIGLKANVRFNFVDATQLVEVTLPALTHIIITNHSSMRLDGFKSEEDLEIEVNDFSSLHGSVVASNLTVKVSNHSVLNLSGSASLVVGEVIDFSSADLTGFKTDEMDIETDTHSTLSQ